MSDRHPKQNCNNNSGETVDQRIAELAELVAAGCNTPVPPSYVREEFEALVDEIRARASEGGAGAPRRSSTRLKGAPEGGAAALEFRSEPPPSQESAEADASGWSRVVSLDDARRVLEAIRSEETTGGGPREDLQRAIA